MTRRLPRLIVALLVGASLTATTAVSAQDLDARGKDQQVSIISNNGTTIKYPPDTRFFFLHGWICDSDENTVLSWPLCADLDLSQTTVRYFHIDDVGNVQPLKAKLVAIPVDSAEPGLINYARKVVFADGFPTGSFHTFGVVHLMNHRIAGVNVVTMRFVNAKSNLDEAVDWSWMQR